MSFRRHPDQAKFGWASGVDRLGALVDAAYAALAVLPDGAPEADILADVLHKWDPELFDQRRAKGLGP